MASCTVQNFILLLHACIQNSKKRKLHCLFEDLESEEECTQYLATVNSVSALQLNHALQRKYTTCYSACVTQWIHTYNTSHIATEYGIALSFHTDANVRWYISYKHYHLKMILSRMRNMRNMRNMRSVRSVRNRLHPRPMPHTGNLMMWVLAIYIICTRVMLQLCSVMLQFENLCYNDVRVKYFHNIVIKAVCLKQIADRRYW